MLTFKVRGTIEKVIRLKATEKKEPNRLLMSAMLVSSSALLRVLDCTIYNHYAAAFWIAQSKVRKADERGAPRLVSAEGQKPLQNRKISYVRKKTWGLELGQEEGTLHKLASRLE